jgi:hypothetical protein
MNIMTFISTFYKKKSKETNKKDQLKKIHKMIKSLIFI